MPVRDLILYPSPWLRVKSKPVDLENDPWPEWANDLKDTLAAHPGIGIAAPQVGIQKQLFIIDETRFRTPPENAALRVYLNPAVTAHSGKTVTREGCLSIPGYLGDTRRAKKVEASWHDGGDLQKKALQGFFAVAFQHELDHLHGILFLDRLANRREALRLRPTG